MMQGGVHRTAKNGDIVMQPGNGARQAKEPPHWMVLSHFDQETTGLPTHPDPQGHGTYIMFAGTPFAHLMVYQNPATMKLKPATGERRTDHGGTMPATSTKLSPQQLIDAAKAPLLAFNEKDWKAVRASLPPDFVFDEVPTGRRARGSDETVRLWEGWAKAFPDAKGTFDKEFASGDTVVAEVTWRGTHQGPLETPAGPIAPTGKRIEVRACFVVDMKDGRIRQERHYFDMGTLLHQIGVS